MGFWDKVKSFFGGASPEDGAEAEPDALAGHPPALVRAVFAAIQTKAMALASFEAVDIADEVTQHDPSRTVAEIRAACAVVEALFDTGRLTPLGYTRTGTIFHSTSVDPSTYRPPRAPGPPPATKPAAPVPLTAKAKPARVEKTVDDPLDGGEILGLSAEEMRKRALAINPYGTAWIGRVDTIPPQSDQRTALIDRGLILRGLLTPEQITEIHRIGDLWLRHHDAMKLAEAAAQHHAARALEEKRAEKARIKEQKKRESAERRAARAAAIAKRRAEDIVFLGRGVSGGLADRRGQIEELRARDLPLLVSPADVARALGLTVTRLRWLAFHTETATRTHYVYFEVPKRSGGTRLLSAPHEALKAAQRWILENILEKLPITEPAHGFVPGRSTVTNAAAHVGRDVIVNSDLESFFPSITFPRVRGVFEAIGYSPAVATVLALLCTEAPRTRVVHEGRAIWVAVGDRGLPQGAPTSPAISNQVARKLDQRLQGICNKIGWTYTRYADDLTFSADKGHREQIGWLLARVHHVAQEEGFRLNKKKCRVQRAARRQEVTGVVVNDRPSLPREELRRLRAILHRAKSEGLAAQNREGHADFERWLRGKIAYVSMIDRAKGDKLRAELDSVARRA